MFNHQKLLGRKKMKFVYALAIAAAALLEVAATQSVEISPACWAVRMTAKHLGVELNLICTNLLEGEHLKPEFLELNPQHTVPTMVDGDMCIGESRAQMCYLVNKYGGEDNKLYPKCLKKRAQVDRYLYFDAITLYESFADYFNPQILFNEAPNAEKCQKFKGALKFLDQFVCKKEFIVDDDYTLADLSIVASLSMVEASDFDMSDYPNVLAYYELLKTIPFWEEINAKGIQECRAWIESAKQQH